MPASLLVSIRVAATPQRAFDAFTREIGVWWKPNGLFQFTVYREGVLSFEPGPDGRLIETYADGSVFEIGRVVAWDPPSRLRLTWRQASFGPDQETQVEVRFVAAGDETRVTVEHTGWDSIPREHAARHGFPLNVFQERHAEYWRALLASMRDRLGAGE